MNILLIGFAPGEASDFEAALATEGDVSVQRAEDTAAGKELFKSLSPRLAVLGPQVSEPRAYLGELMMINAMAHTAVATDMSEKEFHDVLEGLGVLMPLPVEPGAQDAATLLSKLAEMP